MSNSFEETKIEMKRIVDQLEAIEEERNILAEENQQIRVHTHTHTHERMHTHTHTHAHTHTHTHTHRKPSPSVMDGVRRWRLRTNCWWVKWRIYNRESGNSPEQTSRSSPWLPTRHKSGRWVEL